MAIIKLQDSKTTFYENNPLNGICRQKASGVKAHTIVPKVVDI